VLVHELLGERDDVFRLGVVKPDRLDVVAQLRLAEIDHLLRRVDHRE
jgi:hypothetical protein